jgi:hypothetical protein
MASSFASFLFVRPCYEMRSLTIQRCIAERPVATAWARSRNGQRSGKRSRPPQLRAMVPLMAFGMPEEKLSRLPITLASGKYGYLDSLAFGMPKNILQ